MRLNILLHTSSYRGDHSTDIAVAFAYLGPDETLMQLIRRTGLNRDEADRIEIWIAREPKP